MIKEIFRQMMCENRVIHKYENMRKFLTSFLYKFTSEKIGDTI